MRITHPQTAFQGVAPENVFFVANDQHIQLGTGYVVQFFQQEMYPERPNHIFMQIDAQPSARALMYGALLARAEQLRAQNPGVPARLYAQLAPDRQEMLSFYQQCGFKNDDGEDLYRFLPPDGVARPPMGMQFASAPLQDEMNQNAFLARMNAYRIQPFTRDYLQLWQQQQHFMALGFYRGGEPICETILTGTGANATLLMLYTRADFRRQGMAKQLLGAACALLRERGVTAVYTHVFRRNLPQMNLMNHLNATFVHTATLLPGMDL